MKSRWSVKKFLWLILSFCFVIQVQAGGENASHWLDSLSCQRNESEWINEFGRNKEIPVAYRTAILTALSYYPELKDIAIDFRLAKIKTTMAAVPKIFSLFGKTERRRFVIKINRSTRSGALLLEDLSFNSQVGVIGHELAHIVDYLNMRAGQVVKYGIDYLNIDKRRAIEARTDLIAVQHGLGWQLLAFGREILAHPTVPLSYKKYKRRVYIQPHEMLFLLGITSFY